MIQILRKRQGKTGHSGFPLMTDHWLLITPLILSGCMGVYDGGFECPPGEGVGCKSISDVNQMVNEGDLPKKGSTTYKDCSSPRDREEKNFETPSIWYSPGALGSI